MTDSRATLTVLSLAPSADSVSYSGRVSALERRGVDVTTVCPPGRHRPGESSRSILDYAAFFRRVRQESPREYDLVHANQGVVAPVALAQPSRPVVLSLWGTDLFGGLGAVSRWCARRAAAVVVMSPEMGRHLDANAVVIPHGVDLDRFRSRDRSAARTDLGWADGTGHVLFPAHPARPVKDYPRAKRVVDAARDRLDRPVSLHALAGVAHERVPTFMNAADVLLLTSRHEGSPNAVKEALACNLPVVSTDVGDVATRLEGVSPASVCRTDEELTDALVRVLTDGRRSNGRRAVRGLTPDRMARRLHAVYRGVLRDA